MADTSATAHVFPSANDVHGSLAAGWGKTSYELNVSAYLAATLQPNNFVLSGGLLPASDADLTITVPACVAFLNGRYVSVDVQAVTVGASVTTYLFLKLMKDANANVSSVRYETNTTGTQPADSVLIGTLVSNGSAITSTADARQIGPPALYRGPIAVGAGSTRSHEGAVTVSTNQNLSGVHFYSGFTINSGVTITVPPSGRRLIIVATGTITINGTITATRAGGSAGAGGTPGQPGGAGGHGTDQPGAAGADSVGAGGPAGQALNHGISVGATSGSGVPLLLDPCSAWGGAGGGGGGGGITGTGGNGDEGGGTVTLIAPVVILASTSAITTTPGGGTGPTGDGGASGAGGAGNIYILTRSYTDNGCTFTQTPNGVKQILLY